MGMTNFILTLAGVTAVVMLMRQDVRTSTRMLRSNLKHIRGWLEEAGEASAKAAEQVCTHVRVSHDTMVRCRRSSR